MTKIETMRRVLSPEALAALAGMRGDYPGAVVSNGRIPVRAAVLAELRIHGAIGENDGLTLMGSGLAGRLQAELLDELF